MWNELWLVGTFLHSVWSNWRKISSSVSGVILGSKLVANKHEGMHWLGNEEHFKGIPQWHTCTSSAMILATLLPMLVSYSIPCFSWKWTWTWIAPIPSCMIPNETAFPKAVSYWEKSKVLVRHEKERVWSQPWIYHNCKSDQCIYNAAKKQEGIFRASQIAGGNILGVLCKWPACSYTLPWLLQS